MSNYEFLKALKLLEGDNFSKEELRTRLDSMNVHYDSNNRKELISAYNKAIKDLDSVIKIIDKIKTDHSISSIPSSSIPVNPKNDISRVISDNSFIKELKLPKSSKLVNNNKINTQVIPTVNTNKQLNQERERYKNEKRFSDEGKKQTEEIKRTKKDVEDLILNHNQKPQTFKLTTKNTILNEKDKLNSINSSMNDTLSLSNKNELSSQKKQNSNEKNNTINIFEFNNNKVTRSIITEPEFKKQSTMIRNHELLNNKLKEEAEKKEEKREEPQINKKLIFEKYSNSKEFNLNRPKTHQPITIKSEVVDIKDNKKVTGLKTSFSDFKVNSIPKSAQEHNDSNSEQNSKLTVERNVSFSHEDNYQKQSSVSFFTKSMILLLGAGVAYAGYRMVTANNNLHVDLSDIEQIPFDFNPALSNQISNTEIVNHIPENNELTNPDQIDNDDPSESSIISSISRIFTSIVKFQSAIGRGTSYVYNNGILSALYELLRMGVEFTFDWMFDNIIYISIGLLFVLLYFRLKSIYMNKTLSKRIFKQIRDRLRLISDSSSSFDHGLSLENIVNEYSTENQISEQEFNERILPQLVSYRKKDSKIREFYKESNGKIKLYWQWN